ncbi:MULTISPECIES: hypothetical protein [Arthrospira]|nr:MULTISPECIES: hypothetical protein [Arthrospira]MBD2670646.1 hypothetical protein [Arthrospira platensis FACHB-439]MBD2711383.1 hypothetical protein [Arthrospira platensis FACHB-835]MDT9183821.1 hypothetical protein [Limnospira sp. PMC 289.06]MDT9296009.1 hypothetical protein [Arthrospira platensis PCC 7345]QQW32347.1 hypothetical protein AP9108_08485 [Arthrospira sp. PCC 9108]
MTILYIEFKVSCELESQQKNPISPRPLDKLRAIAYHGLVGVTWLYA